MTPTRCPRTGCDPKTTLLPSGIGYVVRCDVCGRRGPLATLTFWSIDDEWCDWKSDEEREQNARDRAEHYWHVHELKKSIEETR